MDGERFDKLVKMYAVARSRRHVLHRLVGGSLVVAAGHLAVVEPAAARNVCAGKKNYCEDKSSPQCSRKETCRCVNVIGGGNECVDLTDVGCWDEDDCKDCRRDAVCIDSRECCGFRKARTVCVRVCQTD